MIYNFDELVDRSSTCSCKYDLRKAVFGREDVIPLWVADMDFKTPQPVIDAVKKCADWGIWGYMCRPDSYFEAIADWQERRNGWKADTELFSWALGVVPALSGIAECFTAPGDGILVQPPVYMAFYDVINGRDRRIVENRFIERDGKWTMDLEDFEKKLDEVSMFILCSPHNPLGIVWPREQLEKMAELCLKKNVLLVSDEIHSDLVFHGHKHIPTATLSKEIAANTITCISGTKTFNLAGLQASTVVFPDKEKKEAFDRYWGGMHISMNNSFSLVAMEAAFRYGEEWLEQLKIYIDGNFTFIHDYCAEHIPEVKPNIPDGTYLVWLDCRDLGLHGEELPSFMINEARLGMNDGRAFAEWLEGYMRLNAACPRSVLEKAMQQLKDAVDRLKNR
ncbi:MAG: PatB family C-S lyase [Oscillospiraceae bacterium]|nr:PatB family C-S lyase [Oscillospiraceae bacterium]